MLRGTLILPSSPLFEPCISSIYNSIPHGWQVWVEFVSSGRKADKSLLLVIFARSPCAGTTAPMGCLGRMLLYRYQYKPQQPQSPRYSLSICSKGDRSVRMDTATPFFLHLQQRMGHPFWCQAVPRVRHTQLWGCRITNPAAQSSPIPCLFTGHQMGTLTLALEPFHSPRDCWAPPASKSD